MNRHPCRLAATALVVAVLSACGVPAERTPHPVDPPRGPFQALTSATPTPAPSGAVQQQLFLVKDGKLVAVTRHADRIPTIEALVAQLLAGPTDTERDAGLTSALLGSTVVSSVRLEGGQATIELASPIEGTGRNDEILAYAQLVCTLTARPEVSGVTFTRGGQPIAVPRADGSLSQGPLTAADYAALIAPK